MSRPPATLATRALAGLSRVLVVAVIVFMFLPMVLVMVQSFSAEDKLRFPPETWGLRQYSAFAEADYWHDAIWTSVKIAAPVAVISTLIGLLAALAIHRSRLWGRQALAFAGILPLVVPLSAFAVALYGLFAHLDLIATYHGLVIAHTVLAVPLALIVVEASMKELKIELELVAMTLGASRRQAWTSVTIPLLMPAMGASMILTFLTSFDEAVFINFLGGGVFVTLPKGIFDAVRFGVDPLITAIAALLIGITALLSVMAVVLQRRVTRG